MAMKENEEIRKANEEYEYLTGDEEERRLAYLRDKAIRDEKTMIKGSIEEGMKEGIEKGIEEGRKENKIEIAKIMLKKGMDISLIAEITNLTVEEIKAIEKTKKE